MKLHHLGYACRNIVAAIEHIKTIHDILSVGEIVYDSFQDASVCLLQTDQPFFIELVSGDQVRNLSKGTKEGIKFYHTCYEVDDFYSELDAYIKKGAVQVGEIVPAKLFNDRLVVFLQTEMGLIELLSKAQVSNASPSLKDQSNSGITDSLDLLIGATFDVSSIVETSQGLFNKLSLPWCAKQVPIEQLMLNLSNSQGVLLERRVLPTVLFIRVSDWFDLSLPMNERFSSFSEWVGEFVRLLRGGIEKDAFSFDVYFCPSKPSVEKAILEKFEVLLLSQLKALEQVYIYHYKDLFSKEQLRECHDSYADGEVKMPYFDWFEKELAVCVAKRLIVEVKDTCKLIVVDCDDTLWSGVCVEDALNEIAVLPEHLLLQDLLIACYQAGKLLCICSKNDEDDVLTVFDRHPDMRLKKEHITLFKVNWLSKAENLKEISDLLNLKLENFLFIDNNYYECLSVIQSLPEVTVLQFFEGKDHHIFFDLFHLLIASQSVTVTSERRQKWYEGHITRKKALQTLEDPASILSVLQLVFDIQEAKLEDYARISELSYRTTQFNFIGKKYTDKDLMSLLSSSRRCLTLSMNDRFGDYGLVGALIFRVVKSVLEVESVFLSCRALGRGAEFQLFCYLASEVAARENICSVKVFFQKTDRNDPAERFLNYLSDISENALVEDGFYQFDVKGLSGLQFVILDEVVPSAVQKPSFQAIVMNTALFALAQESLDEPLLGCSINQSEVASFQDLQSKLLRLFVQSLKLVDVTPDTHFFEAGGSSLTALRLSSKIARELGLNIRFKDIFQHPTARELTKYLLETSGANYYLEQGPEIHSMIENTLSFGQQSLWFIDQYFSTSWFYNIPISYRLTGALDYLALEKAFVCLFKRHDILRAKFVASEEGVRQCFQDQVDFCLEIVNCTNLTKEAVSELVRTDELQSFNLSVPPLLRVKLYKLKADQHILLMVFPHIVFDGGSHQVLCQELCALYATIISNLPLPCGFASQYASFVDAQNKYLLSSAFSRDMDYWKKELENTTPIVLPWRMKQVDESSFKGSYYQFDVDDNLLRSLQVSAKKYNTSLYVLLFSAFFVLLYRMTRQEDITVGTPVDLREAGADEKTIGNFVNTIVIRAILSPEDSLSQLVLQVDETIKKGLDHRQMPFEKLVSMLLGSRNNAINPMFQVLFAFQDERYPHLNFTDIKAEYYHRGYCAARLPLVLEMNHFEDKLDGGFYYPKDLSFEMVKSFSRAYLQVLQAIAEQDNLSVSKISLLPASQREMLLQKQLACQSTFIDHFRFFAQFNKHVKKQPDAIAANFLGQTLSYQVLDARASQLARYFFEELGLSVGDRLAVYLPVGFELIITLIACFKAGVVYVPFGDAYPINVVVSIAKDIDVKCLLTMGQNNSIDLDKIKLVDIFAEKNAIDEKSSDSLNYNNSLNATAYIVHTSGSTGRPKGVEVSYYNLSCLIEAMGKVVTISPKDRVPLFHSCSFDVAIWEMVGALANGATLHLLTREQARSPECFSGFLERESITILHQTPSAFKNLLRYIQDYNPLIKLSLKYVLFTGEVLNHRLCNIWAEIFPALQTKFYNSYGVSETTIYSTFYEVPLFEEGASCRIVGRPLLGESIAVLDDAKSPVPVGFIGEIYVSGDGVAKAYVNNQELTQIKFFNLAGYPVYKTGDLGRALENGDVEYFNRADYQIKLNGFRIDLESIASIINEKEDIDTACVLLREVTSESKYLESFVVPRPGLLPELPYLLKSLRSDRPVSFASLSNGMTVAYHNKLELDVLEEEVFQQKSYLAHGVSIHDNDCIFDVGANIGLFTLQAVGQAENLRLFSFEPVPEVFDLLELNCKIHAPDARCLSVALGDHLAESSFTYYPNASVLSGLDANEVDDKALMRRFLKDRFQGQASDAMVEELIDSRLDVKEINCQVETISSLISRFDLNCIDLLKIDVEKAELSVLEGVGDQGWKKIRQIVVEVHNFENRLEKIIALLKRHGFTVVIEQPSILKGTELYMLYAISTHFSKRNERFKKCTYLNIETLTQALRQYCRENMPAYMLPTKFSFIDELPLSQNSKIDREQLRAIDAVSCELEDTIVAGALLVPKSDEERMLVGLWRRLLGHDSITIESNFFEVGGNSLLILQLYNELLLHGYQNLKLTDLFRFPSIASLAEYLQFDLEHNQEKLKEVPQKDLSVKRQDLSGKIAVVGLAAKLPGANSVEEYWDNLTEGRDTAIHFTNEELTAMGVPEAFVDNPNYMKRCGYIPNIDQFDAGLFSYTAAQARMIDPQQRLFLEMVWQALENAGCCPDKYPGKVGVYAGMENSSYSTMLSGQEGLPKYSQSNMLYRLANDCDFLSTRVAYKLNCTGPTLNINTGSSTGLVCIAKASEALLNHEVDVMVAGATALILPHEAGYLYEDGGIYSRQGKCRPFDEKSDGTFPASGVGAVVLKRLEDAERDGDVIYAVVSGYAVNNDGASKVGFAAPSLVGQEACIKSAWKMADVKPDNIGCLETHGTATHLGDMIEMSALSNVVNQLGFSANKKIPIGSVKANFGHAQSAAGLAGFIKLVLMAHHKSVPPTIHHEQVNKSLNLSETPFYVNTELKAWDKSDDRQVGVVSSFAMGGTNAHIVVEPVSQQFDNANSDNGALCLDYLPISASNDVVLCEQLKNLVLFIVQQPDARLTPALFEQIAYSLKIGRKDLEARVLIKADSCQALLEQLREAATNLAAYRNKILELLLSRKDSFASYKAWLEGKKMSWYRHIKTSGLRKIVLPAYPFQHQSYWPEIKVKTQVPSKEDKVLSVQAFLKRDEITALLSSFCEKILGFDDIDLSKSFEYLGGDSLSVLTLVSEIKKMFSVDVPLETCLESPIRRLSEEINLLLNNKKTKLPAVITLRKGDHSLPPIVLIHPAYGELYQYRHLVAHLSTQRTIYGIQNSPFNDDTGENNSIEVMALQYIEMLKDIPLSDAILMGWSFGGTLAYEVAYQLELQGCAVKSVVMFDNWAKYDEKFTSYQQVKEYYYELDFMRDGVEPEDVDIWWDRNYRRALLLYKHQPKPVSAEVLLLKAEKAKEAAYANILDNYWEACTGEYFQKMLIHCNHETILDSENIFEYLDTINEVCQIEKVTI